MTPTPTEEPGFWDASAVVPLCVHQASSSRAQTQLRRSVPIVWWATRVEVYSAIARLERQGDLSAREKAGANSRLEFLAHAWREILPSDRLRQLSTELLDRYELRAADSLQLAAALVWCQERPARRNFLAADRRLLDAARALGFSVVDFS